MTAACRGSADPKLDDIGCCSKQGLCFSISLLPSGSEKKHYFVYWMVALKQQASLQQLLLLNCRLGPPMTNQRLLRTLNSSWLSTENNSKERLRSAGKRRRIEAVDLNRPNISIFQFEKCSKLQHRFLASPEPLLWKPCSCSGTK